MARELRGLRVGQGAVRGVDAVRDVLQASVRVRIEHDVEAGAQASPPDVLVHDHGVGDLLLVEDHAHPARRLGVVPGLEHGEARPIGRVARHVGERRAAVEVEVELGGHRSEGRGQARLGGKHPGPRRVVASSRREGLLRDLDLELRQAHPRREESLLPRSRKKEHRAVSGHRALVAHGPAHRGGGRPASPLRRRWPPRRRPGSRARPRPRRRRRRRAPCPPGTSGGGGGRGRSRGRAAPSSRDRCRPGTRVPCPGTPRSPARPRCRAPAAG